MKKIALIILLCFIYCAGNSQNTTTQTLGAPRTLVINKGGFQSDSSLILPFFSDTTSANLSPYVKTYRGNMIKVGDTVYVRNKSATKWVMMANDATTPNLSSVTHVGNTTNTSITIGDTIKLKSTSSNFSNSLITNNPSFEQTGSQNFYFPQIGGTLVTSSQAIDSLKRSSDSIFARKGTQWRFQYKDSTGGGNFVPYTGATSSVNLGSFSLSSQDLNISNLGSINIGSQLSIGATDDGTWLNRLLLQNNYGDNVSLAVGSGSAGNVLTLPTSTGTLALTSQFIDSLKRSTDSIFAYKNGSWRFQYRDSVGNGGAGTVTSVATGYGLAGGTITTTGTLIADTSVSGLSGKYLRIVDTANKWVSSVTGLNDSTIRVVKDGTTTDITIRSSATVTSATRLITTVYNNSGSTITKGSVIYINGRHSSNLPTIALAQANTESNSYATFALVENDITNNNSGTVIQAGNIANLNLPTASYRDGQLVYLSPTVAGGIDTIKPLAPNHIVKIGTVTRAHPTFGSIEIKIENGWQLDEMSDVQIPAVPNDSTLLQFSRVDSLWHSVSPTNAIGSRYIKPSDTASMLSKYFNNTNYGLSKSSQIISVDSSTLSTKYHRLNDSLTYFTKYRSDTMRTNIYTAINGKQASGNYLSDDPVVLGQQALGSTIKGVGLGCRSLANLTTSLAMTDGQIYLSAYYLPFDATITGAKWFQITAGNYTADNYNGIGLYSYSGGTLTLRASSTDDGTIWKSTGAQSKAFSSPYSATAGVYFIGFLYNSSIQVTAPSITGATNKSAGTYIDFTNSAKINSTINSATMSSSISMSATTGVQATWGMFLY